MHRSSEKINQWIAGDGAPADLDHMQTCAECRAEAGKLQDALSAYSGFARDWSRSQVPAAPPLTQLLRGMRRPAQVARWAGVAAAAAIAVVVLALPRLEKSQNAQPPIDESAQDALLLQQVNARISRTAPLAMDPLLIWMEEKESTKERIGEEQ